MTRLIELSDAADDPTVGGKAAGLARLLSAGFPVPAGAVVPADLPAAAVADASDELAERFAGQRLAVRSSGLSEDLSDASFAGQFETVLGVEPEPEAIAVAIRTVRDSVHADHLAAYHHRADLRMAVLVMPMIDAASAGVAFGRDPVTGAAQVVIEAVPGLGDQLAAGEADGERWVVNGTGPRRSGPSLDALTADQAARIAETVARIEAEVGSAQDVEWAIADDRLIVLQARAITTTSVPPIPMTDPIPPGPWERDMTHQLQPTTPLMASFFPGVFTESFADMAEELGMPIDRLEGRVIRGYFHVQVVPYGAKPGGSAPPRPVLRTLWSVIPTLRARARRAAEMQARQRHLELADEWADTVRPEALAQLADWTVLDRTSLDDGELVEHLAGALSLTGRMFRWNVLTDPAYLLPLLDLVDVLDRHELGDLGTALGLLAGHSADEYRMRLVELAAALQADPAAAAAVTGDATGVMSRLDRAAPEFADRYRDHLRRYGLRVLGFDLDAPTLWEDPRLELDRLLDTDPASTTEGPDPADELRARLSAAVRADFDTVLAAARQSYPIREDGESVHSASWGAVRLAALEIGRRMQLAGDVEQAEDAVFLTGEELIGWPADRSDHRDRVVTRRGERAWALQHPAPEFIGDGGPPPDPRAFPPAVARLVRAMNLVIEHDARSSTLVDGVDGVAASAGHHVGPVRIVDGPHEFSKVEPGDVLVCRTTASPWEVLFPTLGALVTEGGGLLSHPAIVAREHGLPAVLGVSDAMARFHDGQLVTVDGTAGTVRPVAG